MNLDSPFIPDPELMANISFTKAEVSKMIEGFEGDFKGFQKYFEGFGVRFKSSSRPRCLYIAPLLYRVRMEMFTRSQEGEYLLSVASDRIKADITG
jgi:hypothetical protein